MNIYLHLSLGVIVAHKNQNQHANSLLSALAVLGNGLDRSSAPSTKDAAEATIARRAALKQKLDLLMATRAEAPDAVPESAIHAARAALVADLMAPESAEHSSDPAAGKRKRAEDAPSGSKPTGMVSVAPAKHGAPASAEPE